MDFLIYWNFLRVGIELQEIEVRLEQLNVETEVHVGGKS
jgi:hypothetical protein